MEEGAKKELTIAGSWCRLRPRAEGAQRGTGVPQKRFRIEKKGVDGGVEMGQIPQRADGDGGRQGRWKKDSGFEKSC